MAPKRQREKTEISAPAAKRAPEAAAEAVRVPSLPYKPPATGGHDQTWLERRLAEDCGYTRVAGVDEAGRGPLAVNFFFFFFFVSFFLSFFFFFFFFFFFSQIFLKNLFSPICLISPGPRRRCRMHCAD
jgi:hypothetical protein